jgi:poly(glycerol-phosphate) alpha-glucosyltransferase
MTGQSQHRRVIHLTSSLSRNGGGIPPVIWSLAQQTKSFGGECIVSGLKDEHFEADCRNSSIPVIGGEVLGPRALGFSPGLRRALAAEVRSTDAIHVHGLWMYPGVLAGKLSRIRGCKRVVSPHGMLEPWALKNSAFKKRMAGWCFENRNLQTADCLHALCATEAQNFRDYGLRNPIAILPNGVNLDEIAPSRGKDFLCREYPELTGRQILLFLSRVHPKKGLPDLLHAWAKTKPHEKNWTLLIVGPDESGHESELRKLVDDLRLSRHVVFGGPAYGEKKHALFSAADAFVLPSHSEGFSMAVLEAAASALPIMLTKECNFPELAAAGAAIEVPAGATGITEGLASFLVLSDSDRIQLGANALGLIKRSYTWPAVARQMSLVYDWLQNKGTRPDCVQTI